MNSSLKHTILHTEASPGLGGQELRIVAEMEGFRQRGHRVLLACQPGSHIERRAQDTELPVFPVRMRNSVDPAAIAFFYRLIKREKVTVLSTHSSLDSWTAGIAGRLAGVRTIVRTRHVSIPVKNKLVYTWLADHVVTTSGSIKQHIEERCGFKASQVHSIPTGVDLSRFDPKRLPGDTLKKELGLEPTQPLVGIIGMIRWCKGLDVFLSAAKLLKERYPNTRFLVVGFDPDGNIDFNEDIKKQNLESTVTYLGFREDIPEILASLDILVSASTAVEGVSQAILQAFAMGKPVVATRIGGSPEVVHHNDTGLLVPPKDAPALGEAVAQLIDSPQDRVRLGNNGRRLIEEQFSFERMIDRVAEVYA
jgi:glycosyltransferase involved in cell wall biosynthesis